MSLWGRSVYGDPCRECGFDWSLSVDEAVSFVSAFPDLAAKALAGRDPSSRHPDLSWSARAYVCHVNDNLRIWAERLAGAALGSTDPVAPYDPDLLSSARAYESVSIEGALWSLPRTTEDWTDALRLALDRGVVLFHPDRGEQHAEDVASTNAHDAFHHLWDIRRSVED